MQEKNCETCRSTKTEILHKHFQVVGGGGGILKLCMYIFQKICYLKFKCTSLLNKGVRNYSTMLLKMTYSLGSNNLTSLQNCLLKWESQGTLHVFSCSLVSWTPLYHFLCSGLSRLKLFPSNPDPIRVFGR